jgi:hypothetical protein
MTVSRTDKSPVRFYSINSGVTGFDGDINVEIQSVPEPATMSLFVIGGAFAFFLRRKK